MSKKISTYHELVKQRENLESLLEAQGRLIHIQMDDLKEEIRPLKETFISFSDFLTRDRKAWLLNEGFSLMVDVLVKNRLLSNAGQITKFVIPELIKNYSSHFMALFQEEFEKGISFLTEKNVTHDNDSYSDKETVADP